MPVMRVRVVCGRRETMAIFSPTSRLSSVDLPTLGRPTSATKPARWRDEVTAYLRSGWFAVAASLAPSPTQPSPRRPKRASRLELRPSPDGGAGCLIEETGPEARGRPPARVGQDLASALVHAAGRARLAIVIAGQVEQAVDHEEVELEGNSHADQPGLSPRGIRRDHDFTEEPRRPGGVEVERQHVRAPARAHPPSVETTD